MVKRLRICSSVEYEISQRKHNRRHTQRNTVCHCIGAFLCLIVYLLINAVQVHLDQNSGVSDV